MKYFSKEHESVMKDNEQSMKLVPYLEEVGKEWPEDMVDADHPLHKTMKPKNCFTNAKKVVWDNPDRYDYVEGIMFSGPNQILLRHAWVFDKKTGKLVEPTPVTFVVAYLGVRMTKETIQRVWDDIVPERSWEEFSSLDILGIPPFIRDNYIPKSKKSGMSRKDFMMLMK